MMEGEKSLKVQLHFDETLILQKAMSITTELHRYKEKGFSSSAKRARKMATELVKLLKKMRAETQACERRMGRVTYQLKGRKKETLSDLTTQFTNRLTSEITNEIINQLTNESTTT